MKSYFLELERGKKTMQSSLYGALRRMIGDLRPGDAIPPERELAAAAGVSRMTLRRALARLTADGSISRSNKGTFVTTPSGKDTTMPELNNLQLGMFATQMLRQPLRRSTVTLLTYEDMPTQRRFFRECAEAFRAATGCELIVQYTPPECTTSEEYAKLLQTAKPDIFQLHNACADIPSEWLAMLTPLSENMYRETTSPAMRTMRHFTAHTAFLRSLVPLYINPYVDVTPAACDMRQLRDPEFIRELAPDKFISTHSGAWLFSLGTPDTLDENNLREYIARSLELTVRLLPRGEKALFQPLFAPFNWFDPEWRAAFFSGRIMHMCLPVSFFRAWSATCGDAFASEFPDCRQILGAATLGITRFCRDREAAEEFCRFLLSSGEQQRLHDLTGAIPFRCLPGVPELAKCREMTLDEMQTLWTNFQLAPYQRMSLADPNHQTTYVEMALHHSHPIGC